jgi:hypothetical protein
VGHIDAGGGRGCGVAGALGERPSGGPGVARGGGVPQPEGATAGGGRDAVADAARAVPPGQPAPAQLLGASTQRRRWSFRRWSFQHWSF